MELLPLNIPVLMDKNGTYNYFIEQFVWVLDGLEKVSIFG